MRNDVTAPVDSAWDNFYARRHSRSNGVFVTGKSAVSTITVPSKTSWVVSRDTARVDKTAGDRNLRMCERGEEGGGDGKDDVHSGVGLSWEDMEISRI